MLRSNRRSPILCIIRYMICERCRNEFFENWMIDKRIEPRFCSKKCAMSRSFSIETLKKISESNRKPWTEERKTNYVHTSFFTEESIKKSIDTCKLKRENRIKDCLDRKDYNSMPGKFRRALILKEVNYCCESCHNSHWLGKPLWLEIHHKDGNNKNNVRENLIVVCPNCHSVVDENYRFRNRKHTPETELVASALSYKQV